MADLSIFEHSGKWKLAAYQAAKFFQQVILSVEELTDGNLHVFIVNDGREERKGLRIKLRVHK